MIDESKSTETAFHQLSLIENVRVLTIDEKKEFGFASTIEVWELDTEILLDKNLIPLVLHVSFERQFPIEFPKIFLSPDSYEKVKFIPHVDNERLVCTFDAEIASTNPYEPAGIVLECIKRAKDIILDGLSGINYSDFEDEFVAYWEAKYGKEEYLPKNVLCLVNSMLDEKSMKLICLENAIRNYNYILHASDELSVLFKEFLAEYKFEFREVDVFYFKSFEESIPPFELKNRDVLKLVKDAGLESFEKFRAFINNKEIPKLVLCRKQFQKKEYLFGWIHTPLNTNVNGFRFGKFKPFRAFSSIQSNDNVERFSTDVLTRERLMNRTSGIENLEADKCIVLAGLGSIGSNLLYFLNSFNSPEFRFIDHDNIRLENIGRHLLGFEYIGAYKTKALKEYILKNNPLQKVSTKEESVLTVIKNSVDFLNDADYIFISIGKANVENWICQSLVEGLITKPIFIIWVEPYLCGGHCLFLHPSNPIFNKYFEDDLFKFNVIDSIEYKTGNNHLSLREAGCQTTYIPYSGANVVSFLSALFPVISLIIDSGINKSVSYSWIGNLDTINDLQISTSSYYDDKVAGTLIEHIL